MFKKYAEKEMVNRARANSQFKDYCDGMNTNSLRFSCQKIRQSDGKM